MTSERRDISWIQADAIHRDSSRGEAADMPESWKIESPEQIALGEGVRSLRLTASVMLVASRRSSIGFSTKSNTPDFIALTAMSISP